MSYINITEEQAEIFKKYNLPTFSYMYLIRYLSKYQWRKAERIKDLEERIKYIISALNRKKHLPPNYEYLLKGKKYNGFEGTLDPDFEEHPPYYYGGI